MAKPIDRLTIRGFKSIKALDDLALAKLNILIGANGAGKSNFVSFFTLLRHLVQQELELAIAKQGGADVHLYRGPKVTRQIVANLYFGDNGYEFELERTADRRLVFGKEVAYFHGDFGESRTAFGKGHGEAKLRDHKDDRGLRGGAGVAWYVYESISSWTAYHFHDTSDTAAVKGAVSIRDYEELRPDAKNLAAFLLHLRDNDEGSYRLIVDTTRLVAPFFEDFKLRPQTAKGGDEEVLLEWTEKGTSYPFHPSQLSDGTLRFICLATALLQPSPPATLLLDEPELGLHPFALSILAGLLKKAASRTQVIVSTQSAPLLDYFDAEDIIVVQRRKGASEFERLDSKNLSEWLDEYSMGELWQKSIVDEGPFHE